MNWLREHDPMPPHDGRRAAPGPGRGRRGPPRRSGASRRQAGKCADLRRRRGQAGRLRVGARHRRGRYHLHQRDPQHGLYLSPEQVAGTTTGPRSDVYSAGIMAFELLTGTTPFRGDSAPAVAHQRLEGCAAAEFADRRRATAVRIAFIARATARNPDARRFRTRRRWPRNSRPSPRNSNCRAFACPHRVNSPSTPPRHRPAPEPTGSPGGSSAGDASGRRCAGAPGDPPVHTAAAARADPLDLKCDDPADVFPAVRRVSLGRAAIRRHRHRGLYRRASGHGAMVFWVVAALIPTGLVAAAAWSVGSNVHTFIGH